MNVVDFDGKEHTISVTKYAFNQRESSSKNHKKVREILKGVWPFDKALEEVLLPGCKPPLYVDFLIPNQRIAIEVHGRQHFEFVYHFHKTKANFFKAQARDRKKAEWLKLNDIDLIVLSDKDSVDDWRTEIERRK